MKAAARMRIKVPNAGTSRAAEHKARVAALPHRALMLARFGSRAAHVPVVVGSAVSELLSRKGAQAATFNGVVFLPHEGVGPDLVAHEVAHAMQQLAGGAEGPAALGNVSGLVERMATAPVVPEGAASEAGARVAEVTSEVTLQRLPSALPPGVVSLRRVPGISANDSTPAPGSSSPPEPARAAPDTAPITTAPANDQTPQAAGDSDISPTFTPPEFVEPTLDPAAAAQRAAAAAAAEEALAAADSPEAVMQAYASMAPSQQAAVQPTLGARLGEAAAASNTALGDATPEVSVASNGGDGPLPTPAPIGVPADAADIDTGDAAAPTIEVPDAPAQPTLHTDPSYGPAIERRFRDNTSPERIEESIDAVSTDNPGIATQVADRADVPRDGANDPQRLDDALASQRDQASAARQQAAQAVVQGPGPEQVVPRALQATAESPEFPGPELQALAPAPEAQQLQQMALPENVVASFDEQAADEMTASAEATRAELATAKETRDTAHAEAVQQAETQREQAESEADTSQRQAVSEQRQAIQDERQRTVDEQNSAMADVNAQAAQARTSKRQEAQAEADAGQQRIDARYDQAERDAEAEVRHGEERAEAERERKKRESEEASWWDRAVNFIRDAFEALVSLVNRIFDAVRSAVTGLIDLARRAVVGLIEAVSRALQAIVSALGEVLKGLVDGLLGEIFPELAARLNAAIDSAVASVNHAIDAVATVLTDAVNAIAAALTSAVNALLDVFQAAINTALAALEAALTGDWGALLRKILDGVLSLLGIDPAAFHALIAQAADAISVIVNDPGQFVSNMVEVVVGGVRLFASNILDHLRRGIIGWLTGALGDIQIPSEWNLWTVLDLARQILGLTWDFVRERAARLIGPENVARLEMIASWIGTLITEGWQGLWNRIQESLASLRDSVLEAIRNFILEKVIMAAITWLASLFNPVGALVKLVMTIWNIYQFVSAQLQRLFGIAQAVVGAISNIAHGILEPGQRAVENVLGNLVPVVIDLLMSLLGVTGVAARVREIIQNLRQRIADAVDRMLQRVLQTLGLGRGAGGAEGAAAGAEGQIGHPVRIDVAEGEDHTLTIERSGPGGATVMLRTDPRPLGQWLDTLAGLAARESDAGKKATAERKIGEARSLLNQLDPIADQAAASPAQASSRSGAARASGGGGAADRATSLEDQLGPILKVVFDNLSGAASAFTDRYREDIRNMHAAAQQKAGIDLRAHAAELQTLPDWAAVVRRLSQVSDLFTSPLQSDLAFGRVAREWLSAKVPPDQSANRDRILTLCFQKVRDNDGEYARLKSALHGSIVDGRSAVPDDVLTAAIGKAATEIASRGDAPDPRLAAALPNSAAIIPFMIAIAKGQSVQGINEAELEQLWLIPANSDLIKNRFRGVNPGQHEWIPTNFVIEVIRRAGEATRSGEEAGEAAALWVRVQDAWRSSTSQVMFKPQGSALRSIMVDNATSGRVTAVVLQGHSGAVYAAARSDGPAPGQVVAQTQGQGPWHDELRARFRQGAAISESKSAIRSIIDSVEAFARQTIWEGTRTATMENFDEYFASQSGGAMTLATLSSRGRGAMQNIMRDFQAARGVIA